MTDSVVDGMKVCVAPFAVLAACRLLANLTVATLFVSPRLPRGVRSSLGLGRCLIETVFTAVEVVHDLDRAVLNESP